MISGKSKTTSDESRRGIPARSIIEIKELVKTKAEAIRCGVWFKVLNRSERACIDLAIRVVKKIRSRLLAKVLTSIVKKLLSVMRRRVKRMMEEVGYLFAEKLSQIARSWGNVSAIFWAREPSFVRYLTIIYMNTPRIFKV